MKQFFQTIERIDFQKELEKDKTRFLILILWDILLMAGVVYVQSYLRYKGTNLSKTTAFLQGTLPSLFGAAGYVAFFFVLHKIYSASQGRYRFAESVRFSFLLTFIGLTVWEWIRSFLYPFDVYDIIMTLAGCLLSVLIITLLYSADVLGSSRRS